MTWIAIAFVAFALITNPEEAAGAIRGVGGFFGTAFDAMITFISNIF
ncbi:MAG TPA: hypothetical protein VI076_16690 [Actinopolymorphaceae bacterium]